MGAGMERGGGEREVKERAFDLLTAFDEIISLGYRENVSLVGVRGIIEMESHEEKIQEIIARVGHRFTTYSALFLSQLIYDRPW